MIITLTQSVYFITGDPRSEDAQGGGGKEYHENQRKTLDITPFLPTP